MASTHVPGIEPPGTYGGERKAELLAADTIVKNQEEMMTFLHDQLAWSQDEQTRFANRGRQPHPEYKIDDEVYVDASHFVSESDKRSLDLKNVGPWKIVRIIDNKAFKLEIPQRWRR